jgi:NADPH2:quinone reductase
LGLPLKYKSLDMRPFKGKALFVHFEMTGAKSVHGFNPQTQRTILEKVPSFVEIDRVRPAINRILTRLNALHLREVCAELEKSSAIGKIAIQF